MSKTIVTGSEGDAEANTPLVVFEMTTPCAVARDICATEDVASATQTQQVRAV